SRCPATRYCRVCWNAAGRARPCLEEDLEALACAATRPQKWPYPRARSPRPLRSSARARRQALPEQARDSFPCDILPARRRFSAHAPVREIRLRQGRTRETAISWRFRRGLSTDRSVILVEQRHAVVEQDLVDRRLV